jgi:hypothetical protein
MMTLPRRILRLTMLGMCATPLGAQVIIVTVSDAATHQRLNSAEVRLASVGDSVIAKGRTDKAGEARILIPEPPTPPLQPITVSVRTIGFAPISKQLDWAMTGLLRLDVTMSRRVTVLGEVRIVEKRAASFWLREFEERRARLNGFFMDRTEIEHSGSTRLSDLLRAAPGLTIIPYGGSYVIASERAAPRLDGQACKISYYLDGVPMSLDELANLDVTLSVNDIEAVEVYTGGSRVPPRFNQSNARCGVIAFWTRAPRRP